jgi:hypothetical protein
MKHFLGDQGLSNFDRDFESQKIRDEFGGTYRPMNMSSFNLKDVFSFQRYSDIPFDLAKRPL